MRYNQMSILRPLLTLSLAVAGFANAADDPVRGASRLIVEGHRVEAEALLKSAAKGGDLAAAAMLGSLLSESGRYAEAIQVLEPAAAKGHADAQWHLSGVYALKSPPDFERSNSWLRCSAASGSSKAKILLQDQSDLKPGTDGKVSTRALAESLRSMISAKAGSFDAKTLSCYGMSRAELLEAFNTSLGRCFRPCQRINWSGLSLHRRLLKVWRAVQMAASSSGLVSHKKNWFHACLQSKAP